MERFEYDILIGHDNLGVFGGFIWTLASNNQTSFNLPEILKLLGDQGWEVAAIGDIGFERRSDIILKRRVS
jgi:hypothetical protein